MIDIGMRNANHENGIGTPRRGYHRWFFATLGSLAVCTLVAFLVVDPQHRIRVGITAATATSLLLCHWLIEYARSASDREDWLNVVRRHDDQVHEEMEVYYIELGETRSPNGATTPRRFQLGRSKTRANCLATLISGIWNRHGNQWTPPALDEVAAVFRATDDELAHMAEERGVDSTKESRIQVLRS